MQKNDVPPEKVKGLEVSDETVQFFVRVEVCVCERVCFVCVCVCV